MQTTEEPIDCKAWFEENVRPGHRFGGATSRPNRNNNVRVVLSDSLKLRFSSGRAGRTEICLFPAGTEVIIYRRYRDKPGKDTLATFFMPTGSVKFMGGADIRRNMRR